MAALAPAPDAAERRDNTAFDAVLWALSRPGEMRDLPEEGEDAVLSALIDRECRVHAATPDLARRAEALGAALAPIGRADHVLLGEVADASALDGVAVGSDLHPDDGATVIARARFDDGPGLRLAGPGIDGTREVRLGGLPDGFWAMRERAARYPMGFDLLLIDGARLIGLPRSTKIEVL